jgi:hypothetical protein
MKDIDEIIPLLHTLKRPTFFTRDHDYYKPYLRHPGYCLALLDVEFDEAAEYIRRFLRHTENDNRGPKNRFYRRRIVVILRAGLS